MRNYKEYIRSRTRDEGTCWLWSLTIGAGGYGYCASNSPHKLVESARRVSYRAYLGELTENCAVILTCDNPSCVNPDHMQIATLDGKPLIKNDNVTGYIHTPMGQFDSIPEAAAAHEISTPTLYARFKKYDDYFKE